MRQSLGHLTKYYLIPVLVSFLKDAKFHANPRKQIRVEIVFGQAAFQTINGETSGRIHSTFH